MVFTSPLAAATVSETALPVFSPVLILFLCVFAGVATTALLPGRREVALRRLGGAVLAACGLIFLIAFIAIGTGAADAIYFWVFSAIALVSAVRVVTHPRPVYSALYFVLTVFASAGLFVLLQAEFMAAALVLIYAGAILVTYVFVIMLASQATSTGPDSGPLQGVAGYDIHSREPGVAAAIGFATMGVLLFVVLNRAPAAMATGATAMSTTEATQGLGNFLFHSQLVQLEVAGIILLVSMVGAIVITRRQVLTTSETPTAPDVLSTPATPIDDNPHSIPVFGTDNPRQKAYPQT